MDKAERERKRSLIGQSLGNLNKIMMTKAVSAKQDYKKALATLNAQKDTYQADYIDQQTRKAKAEYGGKLAAIHEEVAAELDKLQSAVEDAQTNLDLSDPAWANVLKFIELAGSEMDGENIRAINATFQNNQPALRALRDIYKARGFKYDGGLDKVLYSVPDAFTQIRAAAQSTFVNQNSGINYFAGTLAKLAKLEGFPFEGSPDPDGMMENIRKGAGLPVS